MESDTLETNTQRILPVICAAKYSIFL